MYRNHHTVFCGTSLPGLFSGFAEITSRIISRGGNIVCVCSLSLVCALMLPFCLSCLSMAKNFLAWNSLMQKVFLCCRQFHQFYPLNEQTDERCCTLFSPCLRMNRSADRVELVSRSILFKVKDAYIHSLYVYQYIFLSFHVS